ncbi:helix-turn-helix transcriptional regulator [Halomonas sp. 141]|uniref:helix-turn-helix transcriptional regulator n=1 Tax=Halomonas sp. 141 TaxID=2056666 RepID=UPI002FCD8BE0
MNRAQFNRYLSGRYYPSHAALQRICHFLGVTADDIALPHQDFRALVISCVRWSVWRSATAAWCISAPNACRWPPANAPAITAMWGRQSNLRTGCS